MTARLNYNPDLFEAATAAHMLGDLRTLLESIVANPEQHLSELPLPIKVAGGWQARFGRWQTGFEKRLRRDARRARRLLLRTLRRARSATGRLRARIKNGPFFG